MLSPTQIIVGCSSDKRRKKQVWNRGEKKIKAWKLKDPIKRRMFEERISDRRRKC